MSSPQDPDLLSRHLASWRVVPPRNPRFRASVRARIESPPGDVSWAEFVRRHGRTVAGALALACVLGAFSGRERARSRVALESSRMAAAYVQGLDARSMPMR